MSRQSDSDSAAFAAMLTALVMIAYQVGGKATRDALFLSNFDVTALPYMFIGSSLFSFGTVLLFSRLMTRLGPASLMPLAFGVSGLLLFGEWALVLAHPQWGAIAVYLHMAGLGSVLISGFWSVVNERFDPRAAKRQIGRIAGGATFGGLLGGVLAERVADSFSVATMLPLLGLLHGFCAWQVRGVDMGSGSGIAAAENAAEGGGIAPEMSAWRILREAPYLRNLAFLVLLAAISNISLDYVFKARAVQAYGGGENLLRFFGIFYAAVGLGTFLFQTVLSQRALEGLGLARTVGSLPLVVLVGGAGAAAVPGLPSIALATGLGSAVTDSLFRSGYEILYTPIPPKEKRATKSLVDVGFDRLGDLLGGGIIRLILLLGTAVALPAVLGVAVSLALAGLWFTRRINTGYVVSLERSLRNRAVELNMSEIKDSTTRLAVLRTLHTAPGSPFAPVAAVAQSRAGLQIFKTSAPPQTRDAPAAGSPAEAQPPAPPFTDPVLRQAAGLRSGDAGIARQVLREESPFDAVLTPHVIDLLAWDEVAPDAVAALRKVAPQIVGQLLDALLDPEEPFAARRRIPRVLAASPSQRAADGLLQGLADKRFEVRFQCAAALNALAGQNPEIQTDPEKVWESMRREISAGKKVWETRQLLDRPEEHYGPAFAGLLRDRTSRTLEHLFRLLSLVLPKEPLQIAFRGLHTGDENLRGIALEYLESVLPSSIREPLWPYLEDRRPAERPARSPEEARDTLMRSYESIELDLAALKEKLEGSQGPVQSSARPL